VQPIKWWNSQFGNSIRAKIRGGGGADASVKKSTHGKVEMCFWGGEEVLRGGGEVDGTGESCRAVMGSQYEARKKSPMCTEFVGKESSVYDWKKSVRYLQGRGSYTRGLNGARNRVLELKS